MLFHCTALWFKTISSRKTCCLACTDNKIWIKTFFKCIVVLSGMKVTRKDQEKRAWTKWNRKEMYARPSSAFWKVVQPLNVIGFIWDTHSTEGKVVGVGVCVWGGGGGETMLILQALAVYPTTIINNYFDPSEGCVKLNGY